MDEINPVYWEQNRMSIDFDELEVGDDPVDEEFAEELALKSPPQEWLVFLFSLLYCSYVIPICFLHSIYNSRIQSKCCGHRRFSFFTDL